MDTKSTKDLNSKIYQDAVALRREVFIGEQNVPEEIELDGKDHEAVHFVSYLDEVPITTGRIIEKTPNTFVLQRLATRKEHRGKGYGGIILQDIEAYIKNNQGKNILLDAQDSAIKFYETNGYNVEGEGYIKANIPHHSMRKTFS